LYSFGSVDLTNNMILCNFQVTQSAQLNKFLEGRKFSSDSTTLC